MFFRNKFHNSTTYLIQQNNNSFVLIDPGDPDINQVKQWLTKRNATIGSVILTHEHADHCAGVIDLYDWQPFQLFCSEACARNIADSKQNFSRFLDTIATFDVKLPSVRINKDETRNIGGIDFSFVATPGHSPGSICLFTGNSVYTGDTILFNTRTPLTFPHSNRIHYSESIEKLKNLIHPGMIIHPGHGEPFVFESWEQFRIN